MRVLYLDVYDAILGYDWLQAHSPMTCDWAAKTLTFDNSGQVITLQGTHSPPLQLSTMSADQLLKCYKGNDVWAFALVDIPTEAAPSPDCVPVPDCVQTVLAQYEDLFQEPKTLPPPRVHDHTIPLLPDAIPVNSRPYKYSPTHKTEIENQVKALLSAGLITHSSSPFASPVLLVQKKKMVAGDFVLIIENLMLLPLRIDFLCLLLRRYWMSYLEPNFSLNWI